MYRDLLHAVRMTLPSLTVVLTGCAAVDPQPDYERAAQSIHTSTGQASVYQPGDEETVRQRAETMLADGLTVSEAVELCLLNNPGLQASFMDIGMARADVVQAGLLSNPSLGVALAFPSGGGLAMLDVGMAQNIADLWQIPARTRSAERSLDRAILSVARQATDLAAEAKAAYFEAAGAARLHEIQLENVALAKEVLDLAIARQRAGAANELDANLARTLVLDAELSAESARLSGANARRSLAELLGITANADELTLLDGLPRVPPRTPDPEVMIELACAYRLDMQAAREAVAVAEAQLEEEYRRVFPTLEVGVTMEREERRREGGRKLLADTARASVANGGLTAPDIQPKSERGQSMATVIGPSIELELPVFDQNQAQIAKARYAYDKAVKEAEAVRRAAHQEVRGAVDQARSAWQIARTSRDEALPLAQANVELSREAYRAGQASFLAVLEAQRLALDSRRRSAEAEQAAATSVVQIERTMCLPFDEWINRAAALDVSDRQESPTAEGVAP